MTLVVVAALLAVVGADRAHALTVVEHETARGAERLEVTCGERASFSDRLPKGASRIEVTRPRKGDVVRDGFGDYELARIERVDVREEGGRSVIEITAVGTGESCSFPGVWETEPVEYRVAYDVVSHPKVLASDEQAGMNARARPREFTANADAGWRKLDWRSWGGRKAVASGEFHAVRWIGTAHGAVPKVFSYRVEVDAVADPQVRLRLPLHPHRDAVQGAGAAGGPPSGQAAGNGKLPEGSVSALGVGEPDGHQREGRQEREDEPDQGP